MTTPTDPTPDDTQPRELRRSWKAAGALIGGAVVIAVGAVVTTLAATHRSAARENTFAYLNGFVDGHCAHHHEDDWDF